MKNLTTFRSHLILNLETEREHRSRSLLCSLSENH